MVTAVQNQSRVWTQAPPPLMRQLQADRPLLLPVCLGLHRPSNPPSSWPHSLRKPLVTCLGALWNLETAFGSETPPLSPGFIPQVSPTSHLFAKISSAPRLCSAPTMNLTPG